MSLRRCCGREGRVCTCRCVYCIHLLSAASMRYKSASVCFNLSQLVSSWHACMTSCGVGGVYDVDGLVNTCRGLLPPSWLCFSLFPLVCPLAPPLSSQPPPLLPCRVHWTDLCNMLSCGCRKGKWHCYLLFMLTMHQDMGTFWKETG